MINPNIQCLKCKALGAVDVSFVDAKPSIRLRCTSCNQNLEKRDYKLLPKKRR